MCCCSPGDFPPSATKDALSTKTAVLVDNAVSIGMMTQWRCDIISVPAQYKGLHAYLHQVLLEEPARSNQQGLQIKLINSWSIIRGAAAIKQTGPYEKLVLSLLTLSLQT